MRIFILLFLLSLIVPFESIANNRFLDEKRVIYEEPDESEILNVYVAQGYSTVLELPEKPTLVSVGDHSLLQIEVPKNSKNIILKPIEQTGETNLFVFTPNNRFNYRIVITDESKVDYVVDVDDLYAKAKKFDRSQYLSINQIMRIVKDYPAHTTLKTDSIFPNQFKQKRYYQGCLSPKLKITLVDVFSMKNPHFLVFHLSLSNRSSFEMKLNEKNTHLIVNEQEVNPDFVVFDQNRLDIDGKTDAYLILKNSHISLENDFQFMIGVDDEKFTCR